MAAELPGDVDNNSRRIKETWRDWAKRMDTEPESPVRQLQDAGLSRDMAFLITMMGKVHNELLDIEDVLLRPEKDDWR